MGANECGIVHATPSMPEATKTPPRTVTLPAGQWLQIDDVFELIENAREITLPPRPQPVDPAPDWQCYALNPPHAETYGPQGSGR